MADQRGKETHSTLTRHAQALALFTERVHAVAADQWDAPTPCAEWTVRDLVNHMTVEQLWVPSLVREGATIADQAHRFDGDQLGDDPAGAWDRAAGDASAAFREPGALDRTVHLSSGTSDAESYCSQMTMDATVHAWDLARAIGADDRLPAALVDFSSREIAPYADDLQHTGLFDAPVTGGVDPDPQTRLLHQLGRAV